MDVETVGFLTSLGLVLRFILGLTLLWAGISKFKQWSRLVHGVIEYHILPPAPARLYGRLLPLLEVGTGALLFLGILVRAAALLASLMFLSFAIAVSINLARRRDMPCFCFGADSTDKLGWHTLIRILLLLSFTLGLILLPDASINVLLTEEHLTLVPVLLLTAFALLVLSLLELSPWVVRAWTVPAIRPSQSRLSVVWMRDTDGHRSNDVRL